MCLFIRESCPKRMIADKAITCYKRVIPVEMVLFRENYEAKGLRANSLVSVYQFMQYKTRTTYTSKLVKHKEIDAKCMFIGTVGKGLHSYSTLGKAVSSMKSEDVILECKIPKGAKYFYDPDRCEYASDTLRVIKITKLI